MKAHTHFSPMPESTPEDRRFRIVAGFLSVLLLGAILWLITLKLGNTVSSETAERLIMAPKQKISQ